MPLSSPKFPPDNGWCDVFGFVPTVVFKAPQHFRSSEKQPTWDGCFFFFRQSVYSVIFLDYLLGYFSGLSPRLFFWTISSVIFLDYLLGYFSGLSPPLFFWTTVCPGQYIHKSLRRWMSTFVTVWGPRSACHFL